MESEWAYAAIDEKEAVVEQPFWVLKDVVGLILVFDWVGAQNVANAKTNLKLAEKDKKEVAPRVWFG